MYPFHISGVLKSLIVDEQKLQQIEFLHSRLLWYHKKISTIGYDFIKKKKI